MRSPVCQVVNPSTDHVGMMLMVAPDSWLGRLGPGGGVVGVLGPPPPITMMTDAKTGNASRAAVSTPSRSQECTMVLRVGGRGGKRTPPKGDPGSKQPQTPQVTDLSPRVRKPRFHPVIPRYRTKKARRSPPGFFKTIRKRSPNPRSKCPRCGPPPRSRCQRRPGAAWSPRPESAPSPRGTAGSSPSGRTCLQR